MPNIGLFEIAVFIIVAANLIISLFSDEIKKLKKYRWLLFVVLVIPIALHEILIVKSPDYYLREAKESLKKAQEKLELGDPAMDEIKKMQSDIERITEYTLRRAERYKRIFEEQKITFAPCFNRFESARKLRNLGRNREAVEILKEVLDTCPDFYLAHYNMGLTYEALGDFRDAEFHYAKASQLEAKLSTRDPSIHNTYGFLLLRLHKFEEAEKEYIKALELDPYHPKAKFGLEAARKKIIF